MSLQDINSPEDLKATPPDALPELAEEIRAFIVEAVARTGGHLGSNLGAVELTLALHRVFDSPRDRILWDTGHQAYVHKLLTGRRDEFAHLRQAGGLSGYPSRTESDHDIIENSHASTALSWAYGLAVGREPQDDGHIVAVVGDGALTGGMAYEALNNIGHAQAPVIILLNDNGRSYAQTVSRLSLEMSRIRFSRPYKRLRAQMDRVLDAVPLAERLADASLEGVKHAVSDAPALQHFVEALGVPYHGPVDGHDVDQVERALHRARRQDGPMLVHVLTEKGRGYRPAETDVEKRLHDVGAFDPSTGKAASTRSGRKWTAAFSETLLEVAEEHDEVVALTAAMPGSTGLLPLCQRHPDRVLDVGIAEQHAITAAAGLSLAGRTPVVAVYSTFFTRGFDQANLDVGLHDQHVVFVFDRAGITGDDGPSHHGVLDLSLCLRIPTMTVLAPSCEQDLATMLRYAVAEADGPVSIRFPKGAAVSLDDRGRGLRALRRREGDDVCVLAVGDRVAAVLEAADRLAEAGVETGVWDVRCVRPADPRMLEAAAAAPFVVTVENGLVSGGAGAHLADRLVERTGVRAAPPVLRLGVPDGYLAHAAPDRILAELGLDAAGIATAIGKELGLADRSDG